MRPLAIIIALPLGAVHLCEWKVKKAVTVPKTYLPKLLQSDGAHHRADLELILRDLVHIATCCELILTKGKHPIADVEAAAFLDSIAIRYRRCFSGGIRTGLDHQTLPSIQGDGAKLHKFFRLLASKHIAHSVNGFELNASVVHIAEDEDGRIHRGGLGSRGSGTLELSLYDIQRFGDLVRSVIADVQALHISLTKQVEFEVESMSEDQLRDLPDGFVPLVARPDIEQSRQWPKQSIALKKSP